MLRMCSATRRWSAIDVLQPALGLFRLLGELPFVIGVPRVRIAEGLQPLLLLGQLELLRVPDAFGRGAFLFRGGELHLQIGNLFAGRVTLPLERGELELRLLDEGDRLFELTLVRLGLLFDGPPLRQQPVQFALAVG